jgi:phosphoribosylamine--glycine ligase
VLPRIKNDLVELFTATATGALSKRSGDIDSRHACTIVAASGGYPGDYETGLLISGLNRRGQRWT